MEMYKILVEMNKKLILNETISEEEKERTVQRLLNGIAGKEEIVQYKIRMRVNTYTDNMYPDYYIPPYNEGKKLRLIQGYLPKTNILYTNHYELEILRLLALFAPDNERVKEMVENTLHRLQNTCFGNFCSKGECVVTGISVLRFLAVTKPEDEVWINKLIVPLGERFHAFEGRSAVQNGVPLTYLLMAFTDVNNEKTRTFVDEKREMLENKMLKSDSLVERSIIRKVLLDGNQ